ncbi:MAG: prepilin peptidase [Lachnospiraceae bacterium]|nr:prepilin peptidase [Lachnospiraceae bacterium]
MQPIEIAIYILAFFYGIVIGSFSNVCILRIPSEESIIPSSHCMKCGYKLRWYDLFPLFSYIFLKGKCRKCGEHISLQYPLVEGINGVCYTLIFIFNGINVQSMLLCLFTTALIAIAVVDWRMYIIPDSFNIFIFILGIVSTAVDYKNFREHIIGMFSISAFLLIIFLVTTGRAMGGGDIKLMAGAGLLLGWKCTVVGFLIGCILGSVIHLIRMKVQGAEHKLAFGPYLAGGLFIAIFVGELIMNWYLGVLGV